MRTTATARLAVVPEDYRACRGLLPATEQCWLAYPTVMVYRGEQLVGFLATRPFKEVGKRIVAGPLYMIPERATIFLARRIQEAYERYLGSVPGVTFYEFHVAHGNSRWREFVEGCVDRYGLAERRTVTSSGTWYRRYLPSTGLVLGRAS